MGVGFQLHQIGLEQNHFEQALNTFAGAGRYGDNNCIAAVVLRNQPQLGQLLLDPINISFGPINLIQGNDYWYTGRLGVVDRFYGLRHHTLVRSDDQYDNIGYFGAAGAHRGKRFMAGSIDETDLTAVNFDAVSTDMLGDAAEFSLSDVGMADGVE